MSFNVNRFIYPFLLPNGLLCGLVLFGLTRDSLPQQLLPFLDIFPYSVVLIGLLLGWRFNRTRLVYAIVLLCLAELCLSLLSGHNQIVLMYQSVALLLPINLLLVSWFKERGMLNLRAAFCLIFLLTEIIIWAWLLFAKSEWLSSWLNSRWVDLSQLGLLSHPLLLSNTLVLLFFGWRCLRQAGAFESSFFWAQVVIFAGLSGLGMQPVRLYLASAGFILILGILESSHSLAYRDELTGLPGRRAMNEALLKLGSQYSLAMLDIDHFKKFNDTHGHDVGDQVLRMVAGKLSAVSGGGKVYRYGGEEFSVIFPRSSVKQAMPHLETLRLKVAEAQFISRGKDRPKKKPKKRPVNRKKQALQVTISIGAAERDGQLNNVDAVVKAADEALYRAKKSGRNRVCT